MSNTLFQQWRARSPWYGDTHEDLAASLRGFLTRGAAPHIEEWEEAGQVPRAFHKKAGDAGLLGLGFPEQYGGTSEGHDQFHDLVKIEEIAALGAGGVMMGLLTHNVALPAILQLADPDLRDRVAPEVISGEKILALAITEPSGGSDVSAFRTTAVREGDHYVVTGQKTFITNGMRADYLLTAVRTGGDGMGGLSLLIIEAKSDLVDRTSLTKMGFHSSDTATIYLDHVKVPVTHLVGPEYEGFKHVMAGFNVERLGVAQQCRLRPRLPRRSRALRGGARDLRQDDRLPPARTRPAGRPHPPDRCHPGDDRAVRLAIPAGHRHTRRARPAQGPGHPDLRRGGEGSGDDPRWRWLHARSRARTPLPRRPSHGHRRWHRRHPPGLAGRQLGYGTWYGTR